jgi:hypothetical protein
MWFLLQPQGRMVMGETSDEDFTGISSGAEIGSKDLTEEFSRS